MTHKIGNNNFIGVEVPGNSRYHNVIEYGQCLNYNTYCNAQSYVKLPPGSYTFCFLYPDGVTEEAAREIVDWYGKGDGSIDECGVGDTFWCYDDSDFCCDTALESLRTLIESLNIKKPVAICKKQ